MSVISCSDIPSEQVLFSTSFSKRFRNVVLGFCLNAIGLMHDFYSFVILETVEMTDLSHIWIRSLVRDLITKLGVV